MNISDINLEKKITESKAVSLLNSNLTPQSFNYTSTTVVPAIFSAYKIGNICVVSFAISKTTNTNIEIQLPYKPLKRTDFATSAANAGWGYGTVDTTGKITLYGNISAATYGNVTFVI